MRAAVRFLSRWTLRSVLGVLTVAVVTVVVVYGLLRTGLLTTSLDTIISRIVQLDDGFYVRVEDVTGDPPAVLNARKVELGDRDGVWLTVEDVQIRWRPFDIFHPLDRDPLRIQVDTAKARRVVWTRLEADPLVKKDKPFRWDRFVRLLVGDLEVEEFELGPGLLRGGQARFRVKGNGVLGEWEHGHLDLNLETLGEGGGGAHVELVTGGSPLTLTGTLTAKEGPRGALAFLAGLPDAGAVTLRVDASGPLRDWKAHVDVRAAALGTLKGDATIGFGEVGTFDVRANVDPVASLREASLVGAGAPIAVSLAGSLTPDVELRVERARAVFDARELSLDGRLDLATDAIEARAQLASTNDGTRVHLTEFVLDRAALQVKGVLADGGNLDVTLEASGLTAEELAASNLEVKLKGSDPVGAAPSTFQLSASATGLALGSTPLPLLGETAELAASGLADLDAGVLSTPLVRVAGGDLVLEGPLAFGDNWQSLKTSLQLTVADLGSLASVWNTTVSGRGGLKLDATATGGFRNLQIQVHADTTDVRVGEAGWNALLADKSTLEVSMEGSLEGPAHANLAIAATGITGSAKAEMGADGQGLVADVNIVLDNLTRLAEPTRAAIAGRLELQASARGSLNQFDGNLSLVGDRFSWEKSRFDSLTVNIDAHDLPKHWRANVRSHAKYGRDEASLEAALAMPEAGRVVVSDLQLRGPKTVAIASLDCDLEASTAVGHAQLKSDDLSLWSAMTGIPLRGAVEADVVLAVPPASQPIQHIGGNAKLRDLVIGVQDTELRVEHAGFSADGVEIGPDPRGQLRLQVSGARFGSTRLVEGNVQASGNGTTWALETKIHVVDEQTLRLDATASLKPGTIRELTLDKLEVEAAEVPLVLLAPTALGLHETDSGTWSLTSLSMSVADQGRLAASASSTGGKIHVDAQATELPLSLLTVVVPTMDVLGVVDAKIKLDGSSPSDVVGDVEIVGRDVSSDELKQSGVTPVRVQANAHAARGRLIGDVRMEGFSQTKLSVALDVPLEKVGTAPVVLDLLWKGDVAELLSLMPIGEDAFAGRIDTQLRLSGTMSAPRITGRALLEAGSFDNSASGLTLRNIRAELVGEGASLAIQNFTATDGAKGTLEARGSLRFESLPAFDAVVDLKAADAMLARLDVVTARADADLALRIARGGDVFSSLEGTITGVVKVQEARVQIPQRFSSDIPEIYVIEVGADSETETNDGETRTSSITLDVSVKADGHVYVDGRGLESEWSTDLHVGGFTRDPRVEGTVKSVRGDLALLGRRFSVTNGTLRFDGAKGNVPLLAITATAEAHDITAIVVVSGRAGTPNLELRSEPALPRDEVLSRVLFGQSAANLTPMQSVQLARSVSELAGGPFSGGPGMLSGVGKALGLDRLDLGGADDGAALSASKYLTDSVYLRVQGGLTPESSKVSLEWKIYPHITIESDVSQDAQGEVGVFGRWDY